MFAQVILSISHMDIDRVFDYAVPRELEDRVKIGMRVRVPFGRGTGTNEGYVVKTMENSDVPEDKIKYISEVVDDFPMFSEKLLKLAIWMRKRYFATLSKCLQTIMPSGIKDKTDYYVTVKYAVPLKKLYENVGIFNGIPQKQKRADVISYMAENGEIPLSQLKAAVPGCEYAVKALTKEGFIELRSKKKLAGTNTVMLKEERPAAELNVYQQRVVDRWEEERKSSNRPVLVHGITGSGKTEIYMNMIERVLAEGKQAIVLVPEISLTPMITGRFINRFGQRAAVSHSKMNYRERFNCWKMAQNGEIDIMIGPRSALFTPFDNLGIVVIDEEHETSYISETAPAYNAVETAEVLCRLTGASLVLGSATPSMKSWYRAQNGEINYCILNKRAREGSSEPKIKTVDMRKELEDGNKSMFSRELYNAVKDNLEKGFQTILFMNRRGFSTFVSCRSCGYVMKCSHCDVSYKYHAVSGKLVCHYCGKTVDRVEVCPACGSRRIRYFGGGTQKVELEIKKLFPEARVLRMDADTVGRKNGHFKILSKFASGEADILVGTQMIAKGHDFPNVTLVGVMAADMLLNTGEYDGGEKTYQLITQVAGRAGRDKNPGKVIVQTYMPENSAIQAAVSGSGFYENEIKFREKMGYPPCEECAKIEVTGTDERNVIACSEHLASELKKYEVTVLGPAPQFISKIKDEYRWLITARCEDAKRLYLAVSRLYSNNRQKLESKGIYMNPKII